MSEGRKKTLKYFSQTLVRNKNLITFATPKTTGQHTENNGSKVTNKKKRRVTSVTKSLKVNKEVILLITTRKFFDRLGNKETA